MCVCNVYVNAIMNKTGNNIKSLRGTDQKCRMDQDDISLPVISKLPPPPKYFSKNGKKIYKNLGASLICLKMLNETNMLMFVALCREYSNYYDLQEDIETNGSVFIQKDSDGNVVNMREMPQVKISRESLKNALSISREFGLTPMSLMKIALPQKKAEKGDFSDL